MSEWTIFRGDGRHRSWRMPPAPPWRVFGAGPALPSEWDEGDAGHRLGDVTRATTYQSDADQVELVNAALYLRRPLLVTGRPGTGKSTLAYAVARELALGPVLRWPITSRSTLQEGLYHYDAIGRLQDSNLAADDARRQLGRYLRLGPLGTALLPYERPRVLLIDEVDKCDIDLPNDLLNVFEDGRFDIPELARIADVDPVIEVGTADMVGSVPVRGGTVLCREFPLVILTSNGEREFPPAFLRRCLRLEVAQPDAERLTQIVNAHLGADVAAATGDLVMRFLARRELGDLATDQLLNAIFLTFHATRADGGDRERLAAIVMRHLNTG
ncbi:AAA family ATPase [Dactylosporangium sp. CS-033363]|uniref:AAA family ATPase n=1 Tax=Dactylosporangium sp. CS-033363 TaxID=3239935 RepID=UPI003D8A3DA7